MLRSVRRKRSAILAMLWDGANEATIRRELGVSTRTVQFFADIVRVQSRMRIRIPLRTTPTYKESWRDREKLVFGAAPAAINEAREELVRGFFTMDHERRAELTRVLREYADATVPPRRTGRDRVSHRPFSETKTTRLVAELWGLPERMLL
jgi:hypothetical protein